jgi:DNA helicase-4
MVYMKWLSAITVEANGVRVGKQAWEWSDVAAVSRTSFLLASRVFLASWSGSRAVAWGSTPAAKALERAVEEGLNSWATASKARLLEASRSFQTFLESDFYLSRRHVAAFQAANPALPELLRVAHRLAQHGDAEAARFEELATDLPATVARRNQAWSTAEQERWRDLFDNVEATPLTSEQRKAVVDFENRNLLVAAAGSGKSSTLVAKIAYAVRKGLVRPDQVLALAFNKKAALELKGRIAARLADIDGAASISSETFHGLGYRILAQERRPTIQDNRDKVVFDVYARLWASDKEFRCEALRFLLDFTPDLPDRTKFSSYEEYLEFAREQEGQAGKLGRRVETLSGHHVASLEEMRIANWLFTHGVRFEYEKSYPHVEATKDRRGYTPDFYYPDIDAWHEHFGVDAAGRPPAFFRDPNEYLAGMQWKRECHRTFGTRLIETTSGMFLDGSVFANLERALRAHGQPIKELSTNEVDALLGKAPHHDFTALLATFLAHWKSRGIPFERLMEHGSPRDRAFLPIARRLYEEYSRHLDQERRVDFEDLILKATDRLRSGDWRSPFKLILVDEFQDISVARSEFLKALLAQHDDAVLFCVGDDWQAINGFAGSEVAIMRNFEREFGRSAVNYLTQTFRSNQGITDAAKGFIERNPAQLKKNVVSRDTTVEDCIRIIRCRGERDYRAKYEAIAKELAPTGNVRVRILGRYRRQGELVARDVFTRAGRGIEAEFTTVHASKGLEADVVILDRVEGHGPFAFPSTIMDDSALLMVMPEQEPFPNAEERRLLYVALTRAKRRVYVLTRSGHESPFVTELEQTQRSGGEAAHPCPYCKNGVRVLRTGKFGPFWGCSRFPDCDGKPFKPLHDLVGKRRPRNR